MNFNFAKRYFEKLADIQKTWPKPETAHETSLAPGVVLVCRAFFSAPNNIAWVSGLPMGEGGFSSSPLSLFRFHLSPFPPETPDTQATNNIVSLSFHQPPPVYETRNGHIRIYTSQYMRKMCQVSGTKILFILPGLYYPAWQERAHERRPLPLSSRAMILLPRGQLRHSFLQPQPPVWCVWYSFISSVQFKSEIQAVNLWRIYAVLRYLVFGKSLTPVF